MSASLKLERRDVGHLVVGATFTPTADVPGVGHVQYETLTLAAVLAAAAPARIGTSGRPWQAVVRVGDLWPAHPAADQHYAVWTRQPFDHPHLGATTVELPMSARTKRDLLAIIAITTEKRNP